MTTIFAKHDPYFDTGHLGDVVADMRTAGRPSLRVMEHKGELFAIEGSHRLAAAHYLDMVPLIIVLEPDTEGYDAFFHRLKPTLPAYDFDHVLVLREGDFL